MIKILVDTSVLIDYLKNRDNKVGKIRPVICILFLKIFGRRHLQGKQVKMGQDGEFWEMDVVKNCCFQRFFVWDFF